MNRLAPLVAIALLLGLSACSAGGWIGDPAVPPVPTESPADLARHRADVQVACYAESADLTFMSMLPKRDGPFGRVLRSLPGFRIGDREP
jgi:hypothetical protein